MVGLSYTNTNAHYNTINNIWYTNSNGVAYIYELATARGSFGTYAPGDVFRIERKCDSIVYYFKGIRRRAVADPQPLAPMIVDFAMNAVGKSIYKLEIQSGAAYEAVAIMKADYYPFGMTMPGRSENSTAYRYGYNGMEKDDEVKGDGNSYSTEFRQYDPRLGRWLSLDPLMHQFPWMSPYVAFDNNPIYYTDPFGLEGKPVADKGQDKAPKEHSYLRQLGNFLIGNSSENWRNSVAVKYGAISDKHAFLHPSEKAVAVVHMRNGAEHLTIVTNGKDVTSYDYSRGENGEITLKSTVGVGSRPVRGSDFEYGTDGKIGINWAYLVVESFPEAITGTPPDIGIFRGYKLLSYLKSLKDPKNVVKNIRRLAKSSKDAAKTGFSVNPSKFDYFFGRVVSGSGHNIARSAQNLKDLTTLGIKNESQLMKVFGQALESGTVISTKTSQYGTTVMRSVNIGNQGSINVGFFYRGGNMSATPSVSTIIPKIFK